MVRAWIDVRDDRPGWRQLAKVARPVWHVVLKPTAAVCWNASHSERWVTVMVSSF